MKNLIILKIFLLSIISINAYCGCDDVSSCLEEVSTINNHHEPCSSSEKEKSKKDPNAWKYLIGGVAMAPGAFILGTAIHEGTHCLTAEALPGIRCDELIIFPSYDKEYHQFYFGRTIFGWDEDEPAEYENYAKSVMTPMLVNASLISTYSALAFADKLPKNKWAKTTMLVLGATQVLDMANHARNFGAYSDSSKVVAYLQTEKSMKPKHSLLAVKGPQVGFTLLGAAALAVEGKRILTDETAKTQGRVRISPSINHEGVHLGVSGEF